MQFRVVTRRELDGVEARVPSIDECAAWAATEDDALALLLERIAFFLDLPYPFRHVLDRARVEEDETYYTLVIRQ